MTINLNAKKHNLANLAISCNKYKCYYSLICIIHKNSIVNAMITQHAETQGLFRSPIRAVFQNMPKNLQQEERSQLAD